MQRLILRNLRLRKAQVISAVVTIAVCAMVFTSLFLLYGGVHKGIELNRERGGADVMVVPSDVTAWVTDREMLFSGAPVVSYVPESVAADIASIEGVTRTTIQFYGQTLAESCCSTNDATRVIGFDPATDWVIMAYCDTDVTKLADDEIIVGHYVDAFDSGEGKILGKNVRQVGKLAETGSALDYAVLLDIDVMRDIAAASDGYEHFWEEYGEPHGLISTVLVDIDDEVTTTAAVARKVNRLAGVTALQRASVISDTEATLNTVFGIMLAAGIVLGIASLLQMIARFSSSVMERKAELALYRALGATKGDLQKIIVGEAFAITIIGLIIGLLVGVGLYFAGYAYVVGAGSFPFTALSPMQAIAGIVVIIVVFVLITAVSVLAPVRACTKIEAASAMQQTDIA